MNKFLLIIMLISSACIADEREFLPEQSFVVSSKGTVVDAVKLETRVIAILRADPLKGGYGLTLAEARDKVRVDGRTDLARCVEYLLTYAIRNASPYLEVDDLTVGIIHDVPPVDEPVKPE